jgi:transketolase
MTTTTGFTYNMEMFKTMTAREVYGKELANVGALNENIVVLTADLSKSNKVGEFGDKFPDRFFNMGIAEQNMMTVAGGMALMGKIPFVSTFAAFASMRACEQVRTDIDYPNLNVRIVATHGGLTAGGGTTHNATEDLAIMRSFANMTVIVPGDPAQVGKAIQASLNYDGPIYIRIGRGSEPVVYENDDYEYEIGKAITVRDGHDATIIGTGVTVHAALEASRRLEADGYKVRVLDMHTIKPLDAETVKKAIDETGIILTAEEHNVIGGLGSAVSEVIAEYGKAVKFKKVGVPDTYCVLGEPEELYAKYGFDTDGVYNTMKSMLQK